MKGPRSYRKSKRIPWERKYLYSWPQVLSSGDFKAFSPSVITSPA
jgi:hypothetical protein